MSIPDAKEQALTGVPHLLTKKYRNLQVLNILQWDIPMFRLFRHLYTGIHYGGESRSPPDCTDL